MVTSFARPIRLRSADGAEAGRKVTWLELFFDLSFVAAVSQVGASLTDHYSGDGLIRYALLLFLIGGPGSVTLDSTRFDTDDFVQRLLTLAQIFGVAVMAINADEGLNSRSSAGGVPALFRCYVPNRPTSCSRTPRQRIWGPSGRIPPRDTCPVPW